MSTGISIGGQTTGGSSVGSSNPLPVYTPSGYGFQLTDGTRFVDVVSGGTAEATWNEGVMFMGKDTAGTAYPIPLSAGGGGVPVTGTQLDALTDAELRANNLATEGKQDSIITAIGGVLTDVELRATAVPVSVASLPAGTNNIGDVDIASSTPYKNLDVDESGDLAVDEAKTLTGYYIFNKSAATLYVKLYNKATAPTVGTDTPVQVYAIPAGAAANKTCNIAFALGIGVGATTGVADNDTGAPAANDVVISLDYK